MNLTHNELIAKGFVRGADGAYGKPVVKLQSPKRKQAKVATLDGGSSREVKSGQSVQSCRVTIIGYRKNLLDDDNFISGAKALRDCIAARLQIDDADPRISFHYAQIKSPIEGTHVLISL